MQTLQKNRFYPMWLAGLLLVLMAPWVQAADFRVTDTNGKTHTLSGYKGKWVLVNYWATWCPPCLEEIPDLIALNENKKNNLVVIGIAMDYRNAKQVTDFAEGLFVDYPIVLGTPKIVSQIGPVQGLPTTYLYNPDGKMVAQQVGLITRAAVESYIASKPVRPKK
ncbi:MAG: TlpA family protein disulfide reductase [Gammaproteobacteria bacterium]|nr:TlpA family protein disulfide reductase [Gammaproteobacteria bacterium]MBU1408944.1 TlpA family protein disulfide reductase [Gammaproteobacteria bacterium]MBU1533635.1 TlpA family protein disulfide reductase [Gammaproteobacteria bacterium]